LVVFCQRTDVLTIDSFTPDTPPIIITIDSTQLPQTKTAFTTGSGILGGERDLSLTAESGPNSRVLTSGVTEGEWSISTPNGASGVSIMQYDGTDGSINLNTAGLGGVDLRVSGGDGLRAIIVTDIDTAYTFTVYSAGGSSDFVQPILGTLPETEYLLPFSQFSGNANFNAVTAIEIQIEAFDNVDSTITLFAVTGVPTTPPPPPPPPDVPPPAAGSQFTWYTVDDDNGREPCDPVPPRRNYFVNDDNVVYYYFYGYHVDDSDLYSLYGSQGGSTSDAGFTAPAFAVTLIAMFLSALF